MAYTSIYLSNGVEVKKAPVGYSWTMCFFGGWPAIFRKDWVWGIIIIIASTFSYGGAGVVTAFFYNKWYIQDLLKKGFTVTSFGGIDEVALAHYLGYSKLPGSEPA